MNEGKEWWRTQPGSVGSFPNEETSPARGTVFGLVPANVSFDKFSAGLACTRDLARNTTESRITYATARWRRARGTGTRKKGGGKGRQDPKSNVRNTSRGSRVKRCIADRAGEDDQGCEKQGAERLKGKGGPTEIFGTLLVHNSRDRKPGEISRVGELCPFVRSLLAGEITEESYAHFTSQREREPGTRSRRQFRIGLEIALSPPSFLYLLFLCQLLVRSTRLSPFPSYLSSVSACSLQPSYFLEPL